MEAMERFPLHDSLLFSLSRSLWNAIVMTRKLRLLSLSKDSAVEVDIT
jgi:hypothetical protein